MMMRRVFEAASGRLLLVVLAVFCAGTVSAQTVDPQVLRQVQGQLGAGLGAGQSGDPMDQSRARRRQ